MREFGADEIANASDAVMGDVIERRGMQLAKYSGLKKDAIKNADELGAVLGKNVDVSGAVKVFDKKIAEFDAIGTPGASAASRVLSRFRDDIKDKSLANIERIRKELGENYEKPSISAIRSDFASAASDVYEALNKDMGDYIKEFGHPKDFTKWKVANKQLSKMASDLDIPIIRSVLKKGLDEPEAVKKMIFSLKPSDIKKLYRLTTADGKKMVKISILQEAAEKAGGIDKLSTAKMLTQLDKLQKSTGVFFNREDKIALRGLMEALKLTKRAETASLHAPTGMQNVPYIAGGYLAHVLGGPKATATVIGIGSLARAYESKPVRNALLEIATSKGEKQQAALNQLTKALQATRQLQTFEQEK
jgi:hypothetical protein